MHEAPAFARPAKHANYLAHVIPSTMAAAGSRVASFDRLASLPESLVDQELEGAAAVEVGGFVIAAGAAETREAPAAGHRLPGPRPQLDCAAGLAGLL